MEYRFLRIQRPTTDSWLTVETPALCYESAEDWVNKNYPGWEIVSRSATNPDVEV